MPKVLGKAHAGRANDAQSQDHAHRVRGEHDTPPRRTQAPERVPTTCSPSASGTGRSARASSTLVRRGAVSIRRWRRDVRPREVRTALAATKSLRWSSTLMEVLLEELYVGDSLEELLGRTASDLQARQYPQAIAVALILRHSWSADDLAWIVERLELKS